MHSRIPPFRLTALAIALAAPSFALAHGAEATDLDKVIVTATRTATTVNAALAAVEVIDREQIDASSARSLPELLRGRAGITIVNQGGLGKLSTLFLRGTESDHTLFLIDGVRVGSPTSGLTSLQDLPLSQIERIEIVRGPRSSLYGADAIGGVIQIFTRRNEGSEGIRGRARIAAGSHNLREASSGVSLRGKRGGVSVDIAHQATDGVNACLGNFNPVTFAGAGCFIIPGTHLDRDGYRNNSANLRADFTPNSAWQLDAQALRAEGHNDYDGDYSDNADIVQQTVGGSVRWSPSKQAQLKLTVGRNTDDSDNYLGSTFNNRFTTTRDTANLQGDFTVVQGQMLTVGFDWLRDRAKIIDLWSPWAATRGNRGGYAQYQGSFDTQDIQVSVRHDNNDQFGGSTTGGIAWGWNFAQGWRVTASHASAFKAPSFNELYYPGLSNSLLRPEDSRSSELSLIRSGENWHVQANAYQTHITHLIAFDASQNKPDNIEDARIRGVELTVEMQLAQWTTRAQISWLDARNRSAGFAYNNHLARRPQHSARLDLDRDFGDWSVGVSGIGEAARWDNVANTLRVGGYGTLDGRIAWRFAQGWTLQANVVNALDKRYETSAWYAQPGREYTLSLRWQPN